MRIEKDTMGEVAVADNVYWGAQTQRSINNFQIGNITMPQPIIQALAIIKKAAATANAELGVLPTEKQQLIAQVCNEILAGQLSDSFPLLVWQTGSGTQTNMNINEVIANRAEVLRGGKLSCEKKFISANDDVNKSQSTNDVFPTAMRIALYKELIENTLPNLKLLSLAFSKKKQEFADIIKIGRTHLMDATPLRLGDEFETFECQINFGIKALENSLEHLKILPIGGTAVGTGLNTPQGYDKLTTSHINTITGYDFVAANNKFEAMASHDAFVECSSAMKQIAISLTKIANDIRLLASGPRCGLGEINLPQNEPGSSIMPGKVNPVIPEVVSQVAFAVIGNDMTITMAAEGGQLELNAFEPVIFYKLFESLTCLANAVHTLTVNCIVGITANREHCEDLVYNSVGVVTALCPYIGYKKAASIAKEALKTGKKVKDLVLSYGLMDEETLEKVLNPYEMT